MWKKEILAKTETAIRFSIQQTGKRLNFKEVFTLWQESAGFRSFYIKILADSPFVAIYWEHPALLDSLINKPYECILLSSDSLDKRTLDQTAFSAHFQIGSLVTDFDNLGKNARLVVPTPQGKLEPYKNLASFIRAKKVKQQHELFKRIGALVMKNIDNQKHLWLNTAGNGVIWLHIRLDSRPKYYKTRNYKNPDFLGK